LKYNYYPETELGRRLLYACGDTRPLRSRSYFNRFSLFAYRL